MTMKYLLFGCDVIFKKMRTRCIVLLLIPFFSFSQKTISVNYKKWDLKSFPESKINIGGSEGFYYDNVSVPEMDLYLAKGDVVTGKAMIICPGGGLYFLSYFKEGVKLAEKLASNGITAFILKYRTYPRKGSVVKWSQSIWQSPQRAIDSAKIVLPHSSKDALSAIEMIRNKAKKYNIDPNKIGLMGFSAGGAVTMEATYKATPKNQPNFIAPIYPWMDIVDKQKVPQNKPPAFISCANDDSIAASSVQVYNDWISANAKVELHMFSKGGHGFGMNDLSIPVGKWSDLLVDWILSL